MSYLVTGSVMHPTGLGTVEVDASDIARLEAAQTRLEQQVAEHGQLVRRAEARMKWDILIFMGGIAAMLWQMRKAREVR
jgi:hypothetical protein